METRTPVLPRMRVGRPVADALEVCAITLSASVVTEAAAAASCRNSRREEFSGDKTRPSFVAVDLPGSLKIIHLLPIRVPGPPLLHHPFPRHSIMPPSDPVVSSRIQLASAGAGIVLPS